MRMQPELVTIMEEEVGVSDTTSSYSETNSRNFQMPERDFIKEINMQREKLMTNDVPVLAVKERKTE